MRNDLIAQVTTLLAPLGNVFTNLRWQDIRKFPAIVVNAGNERMDFTFTNQPYREVEVSVLIATVGINALHDLNDKIDSVITTLLNSPISVRALEVKVDVQLDIMLDKSDLAVAEVIGLVTGG